MYVIIETGGKQYRVEEGDVIDIERIDAKSDIVEFKQVLFLNDGSQVKIGMPHVENCCVKGKFLEEIKGPKVIAYKYKRRQNYHKKKGHRQKYSRVKITEITAG